MNISKEVRVGLLAVVSLAMFYFGFNFLKGSDFFSSNHKYKVVYDSIDGLTPSNVVRINGLAIGRVKSIDILQDQQNKLLVTLEVNKDIRVTQGTKAFLADDGLLGSKMIQLAVAPNKPLLEDGGMLISARETGLSALIKEKTLPVLHNVDSLTYQLNRVIKQFDQTGTILNKTLGTADVAVGTLGMTVSENRAVLQATLANVNRLATSLVETEKQLKPILTKANTFTDSLQSLQLQQTLTSVRKTVDNLQGMLSSINKGQGSVGKLMSDEALYSNVNKTTASLEKLLTDFREHPKRYVHFSLFGKKDKPYVAPDVTPTASTTITTTTVVPVDSTNK